MRWRRATVAALAIWGTGQALAAAAIWLLFLNRSTWGNPLVLFRDTLGPAAIGLTFTSVGAYLFARFPKNAVTWVLWGSGLLATFLFFGEEYVIHALVVAPGSLPGASLVLWLLPAVIPLLFFTQVLLLLLFPDGRLRSQGWRALLFLSLGFGATVVAWSLVPAKSPIGFSGLTLHVSWPPAYLSGLAAIRASSAWPIIDFLSRNVAFPGLVLSLIAAILGLVWRTWRARGLERQQLKWLSYVMLGNLISIAVVRIAGGDVNGPVVPYTPRLSVASIGILAGSALQTFGIPAATLIAITRYRLYDIDLVVNKALVYGFLAILITAAYALAVVGVGALVGGEERFLFSLVVTALIAIGFQPVRARVQRLANRLVYGKRATPYEALSQLNDQIAGTYGGEEILDRMTRILAEATGAERAELWVKRGQQMVRRSAWPEAQPAASPMLDGRVSEIAADKVLPVVHKGQLLGALAITKQRGESLSPLEEKLMTDLASQAGLVLENADLNRELLARLDELRASRQRLVTAQDEERRRIERNIHDGAQQELVALTVRIGLLERVLTRAPEKAGPMVADLRESALSAVATLRELAHGVYPPLLATSGLESALRQQVRKSPTPVEFDAMEIPRLPKEVEAAVYFCCLEALQNIGKHAQATTVRIHLWVEDGSLRFEVSDNGRGFEPGMGAGSSGLQNMQDRMQAVGGTLEIVSAPGTGTTVAGTMPLPPLVVMAATASASRPASTVTMT